MFRSYFFIVKLRAKIDSDNLYTLQIQHFYREARNCSNADVKDFVDSFKKERNGKILTSLAIVREDPKFLGYKARVDEIDKK